MRRFQYKVSLAGNLLEPHREFLEDVVGRGELLVIRLVAVVVVLLVHDDVARAA